MRPRFYVPDLDPAVSKTALPPDEARHLTRVLRLTEGEEVVVFDGRGREFVARVAAAARDRVQVDLVAPQEPAPEGRVPITLVQAVLKGDAMDGVIRDATMMGAAAIEPIVTARTIGRQRAADRGRITERWARIAVSSAKQCRRATVPAVAETRTFDEWVAAGGPGLRLILVEPSAAGPARMPDSEALPAVSDLALRPGQSVPQAGPVQTLHFLEAHAPATLSLLVGPEGGWTPEERQRAEAAGCIPVTLGALTLRADAVAVAAIAMVRFALRDL